MAATDWLLANGGDVQAVLFFGLFGVFLAAERLAPRRHPVESQFRRRRTNILFMVLTVTVTLLLPVSFITAALWANANSVGLLHQAEWGLAAAIGVTLLARAFVSFFTHFLNHKIPFLWRLHRVHHLDTELDVTTTTRFHPVEFVVNLSIGIPMIIAVGMTPWVLVIYEFLDVSVTLFSHSNIRVPKTVNRVLRYVIVTPDLHRVHHSSYRPETDSNFGAVFPIWDQIFGTFRTQTREPQETMQLGLEECRDPHASRLAWLLISPLLRLKA